VPKSQDARNHYEMLEAEFYAASPSCLASTGVAEARSGATLLNTCIANYDRCFRVCYNPKVPYPRITTRQTVSRTATKITRLALTGHLMLRERLPYDRRKEPIHGGGKRRWVTASELI